LTEVRAFVAVDLASAVKIQIGQIMGQLKPLGSMIRWVRPEGMHLTLKFLGEIAEDRLTTVYRAVEQSVAGISPFSFVLAGLGGFPNLRRPRVIWLGVPRGGESLKRLQEQVENQLAQCGFPAEKRGYSPHLTIGRVKSLHGIQPLLDRLSSISFESEEIPVSAVKVMRSQLRPTGAEYSALKVVDLK
jgi:2'-5' RNA ligase